MNVTIPPFKTYDINITFNSRNPNFILKSLKRQKKVSFLLGSSATPALELTTQAAQMSLPMANRDPSVALVTGNEHPR